MNARLLAKVVEDSPGMASPTGVMAHRKDEAERLMGPPASIPIMHQGTKVPTCECEQMTDVCLPFARRELQQGDL